MATRGGARALDMAWEIGQVTPGFRADLILVRSGQPHQAPAPDPYAALVYATRPTDVRTTIVDGEVLVPEGTLTRWETGELVSRPAPKRGPSRSVRLGETANLVSCCAANSPGRRRPYPAPPIAASCTPCTLHRTPRSTPAILLAVLSSDC